MAAGKFGSPSAFAWLHGYNLLANSVKTLRYKRAAIQERTDGLGDSNEASTPTGLSMVEVEQGGALFDTTLNRIHTAMASGLPSGPQASYRILCLGLTGDIIGETFVGFEGDFTVAYEVLGERGALTKANVQHLISGAIDDGVILHPMAEHGGDFTGTSVDNSAATTGGGVGYLQVSEQFGTCTIRIEHSTDNNNWDTLLTFTSTSAAPTAVRNTVTGNVRRYLRVAGVVWGNVSASASISPSVSASASASPSRSPSSSLSPSASNSPSASPSPTRSASASVSPSSSVSPSASTSPSVSSSASASPSTEAGAQGEITCWVGFRRT